MFKNILEKNKILFAETETKIPKEKTIKLSRNKNNGPLGGAEDFLSYQKFKERNNLSFDKIDKETKEKYIKNLTSRLLSKKANNIFFNEAVIGIENSRNINFRIKNLQKKTQENYELINKLNNDKDVSIDFKIYALEKIYQINESMRRNNQLYENLQNTSNKILGDSANTKVNLDNQMSDIYSYQESFFETIKEKYNKGELKSLKPNDFNENKKNFERNVNEKFSNKAPNSNYAMQKDPISAINTDIISSYDQQFMAKSYKKNIFSNLQPDEKEKFKKISDVLYEANSLEENQNKLHDIAKNEIKSTLNKVEKIEKEINEIQNKRNNRKTLNNAKSDDLDKSNKIIENKRIQELTSELKNLTKIAIGINGLQNENNQNLNNPNSITDKLTSNKFRNNIDIARKNIDFIKNTALNESVKNNLENKYKESELSQELKTFKESTSENYKDIQKYLNENDSLQKEIKELKFIRNHPEVFNSSIFGKNNNLKTDQEKIQYCNEQIQKNKQEIKQNNKSIATNIKNINEKSSLEFFNEENLNNLKNQNKQLEKDIGKTIPKTSVFTKMNLPMSNLQTNINLKDKGTIKDRFKNKINGISKFVKENQKNLLTGAAIAVFGAPAAAIAITATPIALPAYGIYKIIKNKDHISDYFKNKFHDARVSLGEKIKGSGLSSDEKKGVIANFNNIDNADKNDIVILGAAIKKIDDNLRKTGIEESEKDNLATIRNNLEKQLSSKLPKDLDELKRNYMKEYIINRPENLLSPNLVHNTESKSGKELNNKLSDIDKILIHGIRNSKKLDTVSSEPDLYTTVNKDSKKNLLKILNINRTEDKKLSLEQINNSFSDSSLNNPQENKSKSKGHEGRGS